MEALAKLIMASVPTFIVYILGGWDVAIQCLLIAIVLDYITGMIKAGIKKEWNSSVGFKGILKKLAILIMIALSVVVDNITNMGGVIRTIMIYYFVANEGLSIIENLGQSGVPMPKFLKDKLVKIMEDADNGKVSDSK